MRKADIDILQFIKKIYADFDELFKKKNINFVLEIATIPLLIFFDRDFFRKALNNLLHNSYKFTPKGGKVILRLSYKEFLHISVTDNGIGIPEKDLVKVFDRFYQSKNDITQSQGSGIGLSFTKSIIEAHNFVLHLKSKPNIETRFTIVIPKEAIKLKSVNELEEEERTINLNIKPPIKNTYKQYEKSILIVEDHEEMRNYLKLILSDYNIIEVNNGEEGLQALQKNNFDVIITDYMMPVMDGFEFINEIKKRNINIPVIVLTARKDDLGKLNMLRLGIDGYLTKPFLEEELLSHVKRVANLYNEIKKYETKIPKEEKLQFNIDSFKFNQEIQEYIKKNIKDKSFGVEDLASLLNLSRSSLFRKTKFILGQTPNELIREVKLKMAKEIVQENPRIKKKDLANLVGVYNASHFYKKLEERFLLVDS